MLDETDKEEFKGIFIQGRPIGDVSFSIFEQVLCCKPVVATVSYK